MTCHQNPGPGYNSLKVPERYEKCLRVNIHLLAGERERERERERDDIASIENMNLINVCVLDINSDFQTDAL